MIEWLIVTVIGVGISWFKMTNQSVIGLKKFGSGDGNWSRRMGSWGKLMERRVGSSHRNI